MAFKRVHALFVAPLLLFFLLTSFFAWNRTDGHLNSPDESANYFFIEQFTTTGTFRFTEPLNALAEGLIHPRSTTVIGNDIVPGGFLGLLILYGSIAAILGMWVVPLLTPLLATIAAAAFFDIVRRVWSVRVATWSMMLLLVHPAWVYYTARGLFPNVPFVSFLLFGAWFFMQRRFGWGGLMLGIALAIRPTEVVWVGAALAIVGIVYRKEISWRRGLPRFAVGAVAPLLLLLLANTATYGHPFATGYTAIGGDQMTESFVVHNTVMGHEDLPVVLVPLVTLFAPFGLRVGAVVMSAWSYLVAFAWWFAVPAVIGFAFVVRRWRTESSPVRTWSRITVGATALLIVYYGSWIFSDSTIAQPSIGTSFIRYWLPLSVLWIPFAAYALSLKEGARVRPVVIGVIVILSLWLTLFGSAEALVPIGKTLGASNAIRTKIVGGTPADAVIVTSRFDKVFFPERRVIVDDPLDRQKMDRVIAALVDTVPVYYYDTMPPSTMAHWNRERLTQYGVRWKEGITWYQLERF